MDDLRNVLFAPIYAQHGVPATLTLSTGEVVEDLTAIDMTAGVALPGTLEVETLRPAALLLVGDLTDAGVALDSLDGAQLALNGVTWNVNGYREKPTGNGIADGEVYLLLEGASG